jgi:hypothetical protein
MSFSAKRWAYSDMPSFSSQSAIACIEALPPAPFYRAELLDRATESLTDKLPAYTAAGLNRPKRTVLWLGAQFASG